MSHPLIALKKAARDALLADASLSALLGGLKIYDEAPRDAQAPYIVFGESGARDVSTNTGRASEVRLDIRVWSKHGGTREALAVAGRIETLLDGAAFVLTGFRLVNLAHVSTESRRPNRAEAYSAQVRLRAYIENL